MKKYKTIKIECYSYHDMIHEYEMKYKKEYQLIGYQFNSVEGVGELVLYLRKG